MKQPEIIIHHANELNQLLSRSLLSISREGKIKLATDKISHDKKLNWEEQLAALYYDCGCAQGSMGMIFAIVSILIWHRYHVEDFTFSITTLISYALVIAFCSFSGKFTALFITRQKLKGLVGKIKKDWLD